MSDSTVKFYTPNGDLIRTIDFQAFINSLEKILNESLSTAAFQINQQNRGIIYRHPYIPVGTPDIGDIPVWDGSVYAPKSIEEITGFGFQVVTTASQFTTPTVPSFGFAQDELQYYVYSGGWKKIGTVEP